MLSVRRSCRLVAACLIVAGAWLIAPALTDGLATPGQSSSPEATKEAVPPDSSIEANAKLIRTPGKRTLYASMVSGSLDDAEEVATVGEGTWLVEVTRDSTGACPTWVEVENTPALREKKETGDADVLYICDAASKQGTQSTPMYNLAYMLESNAEVRRSETAGGIGWVMTLRPQAKFSQHAQSLREDMRRRFVQPEASVRVDGSQQISRDIEVVSDEVVVRFEGEVVPEVGTSIELDWSGDGVHKATDVLTVSATRPGPRAAAGDAQRTGKQKPGGSQSLLGTSGIMIFFGGLVTVALLGLFLYLTSSYWKPYLGLTESGQSNTGGDRSESRATERGRQVPEKVQEARREVLEELRKLQNSVYPSTSTPLESTSRYNEIEFLRRIKEKTTKIRTAVEAQDEDEQSKISEQLKQILGHVKNIQDLKDQIENSTHRQPDTSGNGTEMLDSRVGEILDEQRKTLDEQQKIAGDIRETLVKIWEETQREPEALEIILSEIQGLREALEDQQTEDQSAETAPPDEDEETAGAPGYKHTVPGRPADEPVGDRTEESEAGVQPEPAGEGAPSRERDRPEETATETGGDRPPHTGEDWPEDYRALREQVWDLSYEDERKQTILENLRDQIELIPGALRRNRDDVRQECQRIFAKVWDPRYPRRSKAVLDDATEPLSASPLRTNWKFHYSSEDGQKKSNIQNSVALDKIDRHMKREDFTDGRSYTIIPEIIVNESQVHSEIRYKADYDKYSKA
jgi:hypothetical protein